jgi:hypothetical protein
MDSQTLNTGANTPETVAAPEGHDEAMIAKVEQTEQSLEQVGQDAPQEKLLGKFDTAEDLAKAYQELERKLGEQSQQKQEAPVEMNEDTASELIVKAGIDIDAMAEHYDQNGGLAEEHFEELEKAGIPRSYVQQYLAGVEAEAAQVRDQLYQEIGGQEAFEAMADWARANLTPAELDQYNRAVDSGDLEVVRSAVMGLAFRYQRDAGRDPNLVGGGNGAGSAYQSLAQLTADMKDPRYETDPAFRNEVQQKLARSNIF